jgi:aspartyl-tRNA(Asn)/glutamyl-tRNA(Gln) amidotransferase subunit A
MAREVGDIAAFMAIAAGPDPRDPASLAWPAWSEGSTAPKRHRILYVPAFAKSPVDPDIARSVQEAAALFESKLGHEVQVGEAPFDVEEIAQAFGTVGSSGLAWLMRNKRDGAGTLTQAMQAMLESGRKVSAADYVDALAIAVRVKKRLAEFFSEFDVLMTPAAAALPWPARESHPSTIASQSVGPRGHAIFTAFANVAGCPGLALPSAASSNGLPIGFQLVGAWGSDELLLALGRAYEAARPWSHLRPALPGL